MKFCTNCGGPVRPGKNFCTGCGEPVAATEKPQIVMEGPPGGTRKTSAAGHGVSLQSAPGALPSMSPVGLSGKGKVLLTVGIILVIVGVIGLIFSANMLDQFKTTLGQFAMSFDDQAESAYWFYQMTEVVSIIMLIVGLVFVGIQVFVYFKRPRDAFADRPTGVAQSPGVVCPNCGTPDPAGQRFCSGCGLTRGS